MAALTKQGIAIPRYSYSFYAKHKCLAITRGICVFFFLSIIGIVFTTLLLLFYKFPYRSFIIRHYLHNIHARGQTCYINLVSVFG